MGEMPKLTRRQAMKLGAAGAGGVLLTGGWTAVARAESAAPGEVRAAGDLALWYDEPAGSEWLRALPVGNGRLGAMVYGNADTERLQLNEDTVWAGGPHDYSNPRGSGSLAQIRQQVFANQWTQAQDLANQTMLGIPAGQLAYQPVGDLRLAFPAPGGVSEYERWLASPPPRRSSPTWRTTCGTGVRYSPARRTR
jgi:alpha-L-fucosidase 2